MTTTRVLLVSAYIAGGVLSDYAANSAQLSSYNYQPYDYNYTYYSPDTSAVSSARKRRVFTSDNPLTFDITFDLTMPLPDINSKIEVSVPFSFDLPSSRKKRSFSGRSLSSSGSLFGDSIRSVFYKQVENMVGRFSGADGQACLLRAMCEVGSNPFHDDGILGDALNFILTSNYASEEEDDRFKTYLKAQSHGQLTGDCSEYHQQCPMSFFKLISENDL